MPMNAEPQHAFQEDLRTLEHQALGGLDMVVESLDRALESLRDQNNDLAGLVILDDDRIDGRYLEVHQGALSMLARRAPGAGDLRTVTALLHIIRCVERMGDQCVNIAKVVRLSDEDQSKDREILDAIEQMGARAREEVLQARDAFAARNVEMALDLLRQDEGTNRLNRDIFRRAVDIGDDLEKREWAMFMVLVARALERIGDNAVDIAEQTTFVVTGVFREFSDASEPGEPPRLA